MCNEREEMPPMAKPMQAYQWKDGDALMVGIIAIATNDSYETKCNLSRYLSENLWITREVYNCGIMGCASHSERQVLMSLSHTRELVWVAKSQLSPYPSSPIPEP